MQSPFESLGLRISNSCLACRLAAISVWHATNDVFFSKEVGRLLHQTSPIEIDLEAKSIQKLIEAADRFADASKFSDSERMTKLSGSALREEPRWSRCSAHRSRSTKGLAVPRTRDQPPVLEGHGRLGWRCTRYIEIRKIRNIRKIRKRWSLPADLLRVFLWCDSYGFITLAAPRVRCWVSFVWKCLDGFLLYQFRKADLFLHLISIGLCLTPRG